MVLLVQVQQLVRLAREEGGPEHIHDLRTSLRRFRLLVRLGRPFIPASSIDHLRSWSRELADLTGPIRDGDIALEWVQGQPQNAAVTDLLAARRTRSWKRCRHRWRGMPAGLIRRLAQAPRTKDEQALLVKRYRKLRKKLGEGTRHQMATFFRLSVPEQHEFRRALRWWRYAQELGLHDREQRKNLLLRRLVAAQEAMGGQNDRVVIGGLLDSLTVIPAVAAMQHRLTVEKARFPAQITRAFKQLSRARER